MVRVRVRVSVVGARPGGLPSLTSRRCLKKRGGGGCGRRHWQKMRKMWKKCGKCGKKCDRKCGFVRLVCPPKPLCLSRRMLIC